MTAEAPAASPYTDKARWSAVAADYERFGESFTAQFSHSALALLDVSWAGKRVLDVAAGTGALSVAVAAAGAIVTATDFSPGMVARLEERLRTSAGSDARVMDGQALDVADDSFDASFSMFGVIAFPDWRRGLAELVRATRPGGSIVVASWANVEGAGPMVPYMAAFRSSFPGKPIPEPLVGVVALSSVASCRAEMIRAGCDDVIVHEVEGVWGGPSLERVMDDLDQARHLLPLHGGLDDGERGELTQRLRDTIAAYVDADGAVRLKSTANIAIGRKPLS